ncbi:hypothetical protein GGI07_005265 [Coemansia sp. Benny D115]|nr:hypothetical protein GGI07_005265 [Coemansia sp. Benny D115]
MSHPAHQRHDSAHSALVDYSGCGLFEVPKDTPALAPTPRWPRQFITQRPSTLLPRTSTKPKHCFLPYAGADRSFFAVVDAYSLNLSCNMLTSLPPSFGRSFANLHSLDISGNQIAVLPEEISHLQCLREFNASRNALVGLPITIGSLRNLEILDVSENYLISIDVSVSRLENLRMLNISDNRLTALPPCLGMLAPNLRVLLVDGNPFDRAQRDLVEPILTISSKDAKRIAKAKEKAEKQREKASKKGDVSKTAVESTSPLHSREYALALSKLISVRLRLNRKNSISAASSNPKRATSQSQAQSHTSTDLSSSGRQSILPPPSIPQDPAAAACASRDSAVIPTDADANGTTSSALATAMAGLTTAYDEDQQSCITWDAAISNPTEMSAYMTRQLPPVPATINADSARAVALHIARRIATGASGSSVVTEQDLLDGEQGHHSRQSSSFSAPTTATTGLTDRTSRSSSSQESHGSSMDDSLGLIQDAGKVARVLWQLCDEWDLDPRHSEADSVEHMLTQVRNGNVRMDGAAGIDRAYREKAPSAGGSQRLKILSELLVTEVTYVDTLKNVVGVYLNPMREAKILSESELREIFSNIEVILAFHNDHFLPAVTYAISQPDMAIGSVFLHHGAHFRLYSMYTNNHEASIKTLTSVASRRSVHNFIQEARSDVTQLGQVGLDGHLLTPVQRLPRYRMLLLDLLSNTPPSHPDHESLYAALKDLNKTIYEVNEKKRVFENQTRLRKIQEKVAGAAEIPLVVPHRSFKLMANFRLLIFSEPVRDKSGNLAVRRIGVGTVYRFFLFSDMILQCTIIMNKDLRVNRVYRLGTRVTPAEVTCDSELRIVDSEGILYLKGDSADIRKWAREINSRLEG